MVKVFLLCYDVSAVHDKNTKFEQQLLQREIKKKSDLQKQITISIGTHLSSFWKHTGGLKFYADLAYLRRTLEQYSSDTRGKHSRKLCKLYGHIYLPEKSSNIINLSSYTPNKRKSDLLEKCLNLGSMKKSSQLGRKIAMEKLFCNLEQKEREGLVDINERYVLYFRTKLKMFNMNKD